MIETTIGTLADSVAAIRNLLQHEFRGRIAFQIARIISEIDKELGIFNKTRIALLDKYGMKDENGNLVTNENNDYIIRPDKINEFNEEVNELLNTKVQINADALNIDDLENESFTPDTMMKILFMVK